MKYYKATIFKRITLVIGTMLLLNAVLFVNTAVAKQETEKLNNTSVIMLLGKEMHICSSKTIPINEYAKLFNNKYFSDDNQSNILKKNSDISAINDNIESISFLVKSDIFLTVGHKTFGNRLIKNLASRAPPAFA